MIDALLDAGANPRSSSIAGRTPWYYARTNGKIKGSAAYERLRMAIASEAKKVTKKADWSRVQAVPSHRKTVVRLYEDAAPPASRRIKGRFVSATADSITLVLKDGQTRTLHKQDVRKVRTWRPVKKRKPGWIALGVAFAITEFLINIDISESRTTASDRIVGHAIITLVADAAAAFSVSGMEVRFTTSHPSTGCCRKETSSPATRKRFRKAARSAGLSAPRVPPETCHHARQDCRRGHRALRIGGFEQGASTQLGVAMRNLMGNRNHGSLLKKATAAGLACLLLVAGLPLSAAAAEESCKDWNTAKFFESPPRWSR